jgi:hypothetical protein
MMKRMLGRASLPSSTDSAVQAAMNITGAANVSNVLPGDVVIISRWALGSGGTMMPERRTQAHNLPNLQIASLKHRRHG